MREQISALVDNELDAAEQAATLAALENDPELKQWWNECHLVGDLHQQEPVLSSDFMNRFSQRLEAEPTVFAPAAMRKKAQEHKPARTWVALTAAASVLMVSTAAWLSYRSDTPTVMQVSGTLAAAPASNEVSPYLLAHQELSGNPGARDLLLTASTTNTAIGEASK